MAPNLLFHSIESEFCLSADVNLLGGKGFGLTQMKKDGLPVPPAVVFPTALCVAYMADPSAVMGTISEQIDDLLAHFTNAMGYLPLLSVRSGARVSMPGMMDTILNVGLDADTFEFWAEKLGGACATDSSERLVEMYGSVVKGITRHDFESLNMAERMDLYTERTGESFPDARGQLLGAIEAVFASWGNERAKVYRQLNNIPETWGTAVVVQAMVFGNLNDKSATGVLFTRNPDSGEPVVTGEYLVNAQGEDVVAGIRTPDPLEGMAKWNKKVHTKLMKTVKALEKSRKDMQDVEFTIQDGELYILQTRNAKRSAGAALRIAVDMVTEGLLQPEQALKRVTPKQYDLAQQSVLAPDFTDPPAFTGIPACTGVVTGKVVFSAQAAIDCKEPCILVTQETTPDDIAGMHASVGILTMTGGATSHAAVVARSMDRACVVGLSVDLGKFQSVERLSICGATGRVWIGGVPIVDGSSNPAFQAFRSLLWETSGCHHLTSTLDPRARLIRAPELTLIPTAEAVAFVKQAVAEGEVLLNLRPQHTAEEAPFFACFAGNEKALQFQLIDALEKGLTEEEQARVQLITTVHSEKIATVNTATTLEELVLHSKGPLFLSASLASSKAAEKVLGWKSGEGIAPAVVGKVAPGGYVSERQLIAELLA